MSGRDAPSSQRNTKSKRQSICRDSFRLSGQFLTIGDCWLLELSNALVIESRIYRWQNLGDKLGFSREEMEECERLWVSGGVNPVYELLTRWGKMEGATFRVLREKLRELGRLDVLMLLEEAIKGEFQLEVEIWMDEGKAHDFTVHSSKTSTISQILQQILNEHGLAEDDIVFISPINDDFHLDWSTKAVKLKGRELVLATVNCPRLGQLQRRYRRPSRCDDDISDTSSNVSNDSNRSGSPQPPQVIVKHYFVFDRCNIGTVQTNPYTPSPSHEGEVNEGEQGNSASLPRNTLLCPEQPDYGYPWPHLGNHGQHHRHLSARSPSSDIKFDSISHPRPPPPLPKKKSGPVQRKILESLEPNNKDEPPLHDDFRCKMSIRNQNGSASVSNTYKEVEVPQPCDYRMGSVKNKQEDIYMPLLRQLDEGTSDESKEDDGVAVEEDKFSYDSSKSLSPPYSYLEGPLSEDSCVPDNMSSASMDRRQCQQSLLVMCDEHPAWHPNVPPDISEIERVTKPYRRQDGWYFIHPYLGSVVVTVTFQAALKHYKIFQDTNGKIYFDKNDYEFRTLEDIIEVYRFRDLPAKSSSSSASNVNPDPTAPPLPERGSHVRLRRAIPVDPNLGF